MRGAAGILSLVLLAAIPACWRGAGLQRDESGLVDTDTGQACVHPTVVESCSEGWCRIEPGCFVMGRRISNQMVPETSPYEEARHEVTITRPFYIKTNEVTQDEWEALMGFDPSLFTSCGGSCPVESVSWYDAMAYCNALSASEGLEQCYEDPDDGTPYDAADAADYVTPEWPGLLDCAGYRLPSEAEWEYAARAGTETVYTTGPVTIDDVQFCELDDNLDVAGWYCGNASQTTHPVGEKMKNDWGLYDVQGNVSEWTWDCFSYYDGDATDPLGGDPSLFRVSRGGCWSSSASGCRLAYRGETYPYNSGLGMHGVRPARTITGID
ncbi:MAG: formylglycine-generating enzyme family protein [Polyangia bacterium]